VPAAVAAEGDARRKEISALGMLLRRIEENVKLGKRNAGRKCG